MRNSRSGDPRKSGPYYAGVIEISTQKTASGESVAVIDYLGADNPVIVGSGTESMNLAQLRAEWHRRGYSKYHIKALTKIRHIYEDHGKVAALKAYDADPGFTNKAVVHKTASFIAESGQYIWEEIGISFNKDDLVAAGWIK